MRTALTTSIIVVGLLLSAGPAAALSCAEPEPFDMEGAIAGADAAAVATIASILGDRDLEGNGSVILLVEVDEVYKGTMPRRLLLHRSLTVWGPYYEEGDELALLAAGGNIGDGDQALCGPWYSADDLRIAGAEPAPAEPTTLVGWIRNLIEVLRASLGL